MTLNSSVADDQLGQYYRKTAAIAERLGKSLPFSGVMSALQRIHDGQLAGNQAPDLWIWKTIKIGTGLKSYFDFDRALSDVGSPIGFGDNDVHDMITRASNVVSKTEKEVDLVNISVRELGLIRDDANQRGFLHKNVLGGALELGLELCTPEIGLQLRLQYRDQRDGENIFVGMEYISITGVPGVFLVGCNEGRRQIRCSYFGCPEMPWPPASRFVFVLPRK